MRNEVKVLAATLVLGAVVVWGPGALDGLSGMQTFRIAEVEVSGTHVLVKDSIVAQMRLGQFASVWGDREVWADRLSRHPLIREARVERRLPNRLRVEIEERRPVALAASPTLEPIDAEGVRLPIDPTLYRLDLPIIQADRRPPEDAAVFPAEVRALASEVEHLWQTDVDFYQRISTIRRAADGSVVTRLMSPDVELVLPGQISLGRLREALAALDHAIAADPAHLPTVVDLRFAGQVVVRRER
jgi:cell division protein FtsQ